MKQCVKCKAQIPISLGICGRCGTSQPQSPGMYKGKMAPTQLALSNEEKAQLMSHRQQAEAQGNLPRGNLPRGNLPGDRSSRESYGVGPTPRQGQAPLAQLGQPQPYGAPQQVSPVSPYGTTPQATPQIAGPGVAPAPYSSSGPAYSGPYGSQSVPQGGVPQGGVPQAAVAQYTEPIRALSAPGVWEGLQRWDEILATALLVFGVLLVACVVAPWNVGKPASFAWSVLQTDAPMLAKLVPIVMATTGVAAVLLGAARVSYSTRALLAATIGLTPLSLQLISHKPFAWQTVAGLCGTLLVATGLVWRSRRDDLAPKLVCSVGVAVLLAIYLVPQGGKLPVLALLDSLKGSTAQLVATLVGGGELVTTGLLPLAIVLASLCVWIPGPQSTRFSALAWLVLCWGLVASTAHWLTGPAIVETLKSNLPTILYLPVSLLAWNALSCLGMAGIATEDGVSSGYAG